MGHQPNEETVSGLGYFISPQSKQMTDSVLSPRMDYEYQPFADTDSVVSDG